jgi:hypothetical protein
MPLFKELFSYNKEKKKKEIITINFILFNSSSLLIIKV